MKVICTGGRTSTILMALALVAYSVPARGSPSCPTYAEARATYPEKHLWWHGREHCWNATRSSRRHFIRKPERSRPTTPEPIKNDTTPMILFPALVQGAGVEPQMLTGAPSSKWPPIIDVDAITAAADPPDECCWPPLEPEPADSFRERWQAMPSNWFTARMEQRP